ncbi:DMT family transporter [Patescibacteria group bacterium]|nr:DMT family transporter [Patescibacteria group bacterium]
MSWLIWASIGYFFNATALAVDKALLNRQELREPAVYTLLQAILGLLVLVLLPWIVWPSGSAMGLGLIAGFFFALGLWLMFKVLAVGEASRVPAFIGSLSPLFVFAASWLMIGERLSPLALSAFIVLVVGGFFMVGGPGGLRGRSLGLAIGSALAFALSYVFLKITFEQSSFFAGLVLIRLGVFLASLFLLLIPGTWQTFVNSFKSGAKVKFAFIGGQASGALSGLLTSYAISLASVTLVNALQGVQYVFLLIMALVVSFKYPQLFKDEFGGQTAVRKIIGTFAVVVGLWLLSIS